MRTSNENVKREPSKNELINYDFVESSKKL